MKKVLAVLVGVTMAMTLVGVMGASAATPPGAVKAVVVNRHMVAGGISVSLSAVTTSIPRGALYTWDYTNDGVFESPLRRTPDFTYIYRGPLPGSVMTATVAVYFPGAPPAYRDSVTFSLRIPFVHGHSPILHGHGPILHGHGPILHGHGPILHGHSPVLHS
jgi:hypothetical protein